MKVYFLGERAKCACLFAFAAILGLNTSQLDAQKTKRRTAASSSRHPVNNMAELPCPSEKKYQELATKLRIEISEESEKIACDDSFRAKLGKVILLASNLRADLPKSWQKWDRKSPLTIP